MTTTSVLESILTPFLPACPLRYATDTRHLDYQSCVPS